SVGRQLVSGAATASLVLAMGMRPHLGVGNVPGGPHDGPCLAPVAARDLAGAGKALVWARRPVMLRQQTERWWAVALRGLVAVIFGVVALVWPNLTLAAIVVLYGVFAIADGATGLVTLLFGFRRVGPRWFQLLDALLSIAAGLIALLWPGITSLALIWLIAAWALRSEEHTSELQSRE